MDMVPSGYWTKEKITTTAKTWNSAPSQEKHFTEILPADYQPVNITDMVEQQTRLSPQEQQQLLHTLLDFAELFQGRCGKFNGDPIELDLIAGSKPYYGRPFSIPKAYEQVTKNKKRLVSLKLLSPVTSSEWAAPTFIIPKKNNTVCIITDFRGLNKCLI